MQTEVTAVAVMPCHPSWSAQVTTLTVVAKRRIALRKSEVKSTVCGLDTRGFPQIIQRNTRKISVEFADQVDVVRIDQIGSAPAIKVVLGETLIREASIGFGEARSVLCCEYFGTDGLVIASIIALVEFVSAAELGTDGIPEQFHHLDPIDCVVAA